MLSSFVQLNRGHRITYSDWRTGPFTALLQQSGRSRISVIGQDQSLAHVPRTSQERTFPQLNSSVNVQNTKRAPHSGRPHVLLLNYCPE
jgi:hypothetical protein